MVYNLVYHADVEKVDLPRIDEKNKSMIKRAIEERLTMQPEIYGKPLQRTLKRAIEERLKTQPEIYGKPLQRTLKGYWKLRVGEFRIVFKIFGNELRIYGIIHRKRVYRDIVKRMT